MNEQKVQRLELDDPEVISAKKVSARLEICQCDEKLCSCCQIIASGMRGMGAAAFQSGLLKGAISQTRNIAYELNTNKAKNKKCKLVRPFLMRMLGELEQKWKRGDYYELRQEDWKALRSKTAGRNQEGDSGRTEPDERATGSGEESDRREGDSQPTGDSGTSEGSNSGSRRSNDRTRVSDERRDNAGATGDSGADRHPAN